YPRSSNLLDCTRVGPGKDAARPNDLRRYMSTPKMPADAPDGEITLLLRRVEDGDAQAADRILPLVYDELRKLAAAKMSHEAPGQTLQPTALVHEAWLRLGGERQPAWQNRAHFFAAAAEAMRRILVDNARRRRAERHGGALQKVSVDQTGFDVAAPQLDDEGILQLDEALALLAAHDPRKAEVVKLCHFVGLTLEEAATAMGISDRTAKRDWAYARAWLFNEMKAMRGPPA
ncbi:MAG TPA: ECF-type sigma factor, partial [Opitutaceae bacterium]|nr:ECF-type sigma factor [Opitutaceae bacterium]